MSGVHYVKDKEPIKKPHKKQCSQSPALLRRVNPAMDAKLQSPNDGVLLTSLPLLFATTR